MFTNLNLLEGKILLLECFEGWFELEELELEVFEMLGFI